MRRWNSRTVLIGALCLGLVLMTVLIASCGGSATSTTTSVATSTTSGGATTTSVAASTTTTGQAAPTKFTVLVTNPSLMPFYEVHIAVDQGFFAKRGLEVKVVAVDGTDAAIQAFASGQGDIVQGAVGSYLRPAATGQFSPVAFFMVTLAGVFDIVVPADSAIKTPAELDGKVIGANTEQDPGGSLILNLNRTEKINAKTLVVGDPLGALAAFERKEMAAYSGALPDIATLQARGFALRSIIPTSLRAANGGDAYWALRKTMDANPAAFAAFVAALAEACDYIGRDAQKLVDWVNSKEPIPAADMPFNLALAKSLIELRPTSGKPGSIDPAIWGQWWDTLVANKVIDASIGKPTDFYTNEFQSK